MRQFIDEALYHPEYGYFAKNANIFMLDNPIDFGNVMDIDDYQTRLSRLYKSMSLSAHFYQLWHTPSELFQPHYGAAIADYMIKNQKGHDKLIIHEVGPGTGTLCANITDHLNKVGIPYQYNLIEISEKLFFMQRERFKNDKHVKVRHKSFFDLQEQDDRQGFLIAMEVWDNLSQDVVQYGANGELLQGIVEIDEHALPYDIPGLYNVLFEPARDPLIIDTVNAMERQNYNWQCVRWSPKEYFQFLGFDTSYKWQYIPTGIFAFLRQFMNVYPNSKLIVSDFDSLPGRTPGYDSPVVQTRYKGDTVNCSSILLKKGLFDIFFPVNFDLMTKMFKSISKNEVTTMKHRAFLKQYANVEKTCTRSGYNPMLEEFENVSFLLT